MVFLGGGAVSYERGTPVEARLKEGWVRQASTPIGPPYDPRHRATIVSYGGGGSYERGTPVG